MAEVSRAQTTGPRAPRLDRRRERLLSLATLAATLVICLGTAELVLRFLPVATGMRTEPVTAASPVFHFRPNRIFVFSRDWDLALVNRGRINNVGFVNDQDYRKDAEGPLLAVVGDSYIEAAMVPYRDTMHGRLAHALDGRLRVYSFGASGAPLSQYLGWARYAVQEWRAQSLVINVVGNDFDASLAAYGREPGFWHYVRGEAGRLDLRLFEYRPSLARDLAVSSALARYLIFNLRMGRYWFELKAALFGGPAMAAPRYAGNTAADASEARVNDSLEAIDAFFRDLPGHAGLPPSRVTFTLDGFRYPAYRAQGENTYFDLMRKAFRAKAEALGYEVLDLDPAFFERHARTGERFEYHRDGHWNSAGHAVAAEAVLASRLLQSQRP